MRIKERDHIFNFKLNQLIQIGDVGDLLKESGPADFKSALVYIIDQDL